ncbi:MAG: kynureninase [Bacteroidota bacterium]|nr:kynureninase [Bacteroidota bacterium]
MSQAVENYSIQLDDEDSLHAFRSEFRIPRHENSECIYFCGNSLGLQPRKARDFVNQELDDWAKYGVEGHLKQDYPWYSYHEFLSEPMAELVGAKPHEVVIMNTLTVNLHLMMVSFYRPTKARHKILIEYSAFPSDRYAVESQIRFHGYNPEDSIVILTPEPGSNYISAEIIKDTFEKQGDQIALVLIGSVNYYTGQAYPIPLLCQQARQYGCKIGFDLAHGAGNLNFQLHNDGPDFAVWCSYKYLNAGPGGLAGCFIHERHAENFELPRFAGWWGHDKKERFKMESKLKLMSGAEGWQVSNPPIFPMASLRASLDVFHRAGILNLRKKSIALSGYLMHLIQSLEHPDITILTPEHAEERGCQISIQIKNGDKSIYHKISKKNIIADWREPDVIRVAPVPLYNSFQEVFQFYEAFKNVVVNHEE